MAAGGAVFDPGVIVAGWTGGVALAPMAIGVSRNGGSAFAASMMVVGRMTRPTGGPPSASTGRLPGRAPPGAVGAR
jgi:hypothetical protein